MYRKSPPTKCTNSVQVHSMPVSTRIIRRRSTRHFYTVTAGDGHRLRTSYIQQMVGSVDMTPSATTAMIHTARTSSGYVPNSTTRTPATNTTNGRAHNNSTTCCTTNSPPTDKICHIPTSWHVKMFGSGIDAMWQICCRTVVSSSVGGVRWWCCTTCP